MALNRPPKKIISLPKTLIRKETYSQKHSYTRPRYI